MDLRFACLGAVAALCVVSSAGAKEYPIGQAQEKEGMHIAAVYLQPIEMDPPGMMRDAKDSDIHLEADIKAAKGNPNGFAEGDWMPYLNVDFELVRLDGGKSQKGELMPMVANDGPHYGDNLKLSGPGKYKLILTIKPPSENPQAHFGRHVDKETGVGHWFKPFTVDYEFVYAGTGKKGGY
jgi:periplasmic iron binding protein